MKVLSRYFKPKITTDTETQTEEDFYHKYMLKKEKIKELKQTHYRMERIHNEL